MAKFPQNTNAERLWQADPHQYGPGKIHAIDPERPGVVTYCGRATSSFPGRPISTGIVECKVCVGKLGRQQEPEREKEPYAEKDHTEIGSFRERLQRYRQTAEWKTMSAKVLERANHLCEGCRAEPATEAHHLTYKHVGNEFLWELRAVCETCHKRFHGEI